MFREEGQKAMPIIYGGPGRYIQGKGELTRLGEHAGELGCAAFVVLDTGTDERLGDVIGPAFAHAESQQEPIFETVDGPCTERTALDLGNRAAAEGCDVVVGIGGGRVLDIAKAVAYFAEMPLVLCPTAASTDAPCSALSVLYREDGTFDRYLHLPESPDMVVVDADVVASAPLRMTVAGMGDALATYFEARSCAAAHGVNELDGAPGALALLAAHACFETLMECGVAAMRDIKKDRMSDAVERVIECNILLSGIGFESGGLALAPATTNGLTVLPGCRAMHGEAVAFGLCVQLRLERAKELDQVLEFCQRVGLPTTLEELGLADTLDADLTCVAMAALSNDRNMANVPSKLSIKKLVQLMRG